MDEVPLKITVETNRDGPWDGAGALVFVRVPGRWYHGGDDTQGRAVRVAKAGGEVRELSAWFAGIEGRELLSAEWTVTGDPAVVAGLAVFHDCPRCHEGVAVACRYLEENRAGQVAVGQLKWA